MYPFYIRIPCGAIYSGTYHLLDGDVRSIDCLYDLIYFTKFTSLDENVDG